MIITQYKIHDRCLEHWGSTGTPDPVGPGPLEQALSTEAWVQWRNGTGGVGKNPLPED